MAKKDTKLARLAKIVSEMADDLEETGIEEEFLKNRGENSAHCLTKGSRPRSGINLGMWRRSYSAYINYEDVRRKQLKFR